MYHLHNILSTAVHKILHSEGIQGVYAQWCAFYNGLESTEKSRVSTLDGLFTEIAKQKKPAKDFAFKFMYSANLLCFSALSKKEEKKFHQYFEELYSRIALAKYGRQKIEQLILDRDSEAIETAEEAIIHYTSCALGSLSIEQLVDIYNKFVKAKRYKEEWQRNILQGLYYSVRQQLVSTRITNEDIIAFRQFELYNSVQQRLQNTKLSLACRHLNIQQRQYLWSELFLRATQEYNKYKGLLTYLEVRGTDFFKDFCSELEARITEHTTTINNAIDGCHLSPSQIDRIERVLHEEDTDVLNSPTAVQLIYARYTLGKSLTELHLLQENNYLKANSQHRIELHQYYQGLDLFQKQQLVDDIKKLVDLTRRLLTQPNLSARVVNKVIIRKISRAYYPDALYTSSQIEHAVCKIRRILSELDFSQFFLHRAVSGTLVNKFVSKILHAPRPFSNEDEFIESIVVSLISILGNKHIESLIQNTATMSGELRALCRREITRKLQGQINWMQFIKSRVNRNKRKDYQYAKTLHQSLVAD